MARQKNRRHRAKHTPPPEHEVPTHFGWGGSQIPRTERQRTQQAVERETNLRHGQLSYPAGAFPDVSGGSSPAANFASALMSGDPTAHEMVYKALDPRSLADRFIADSYQINNRWQLRGSAAKRMDETMERYRQEVRRAHRFYLDDDFVTLATEVSSVRTTAEKLLYRLQFATLPYELTWMEMDVRVKMRTIHRLRGMPNRSLEGVPDRLGMLLYRINTTDALCQLFSSFSTGDDIIAPFMTCFFFSTTERDFALSDVKHFGATPLVLVQDIRADGTPFKEVEITDADLAAEAASPGNFAKSCLWGFGQGPVGIVDEIEKLRMMQTPLVLQRHGDAGLSRYGNVMQEVGPEQINRARWAIMQAELGEFIGWIRWVVCVLAMLNEIPVKNQHVQPEGQYRVGLTQKRRYLDFHRLTLRLPKTKPVDYIDRKLKPSGTKRRAHMVRGHWRVYPMPNMCGREEHQWEYDHDAGYRLCGKCMAQSVFIHEHPRGDAELGWVRKEYVIKKEP